MFSWRRILLSFCVVLSFHMAWSQGDVNDSYIKLYNQTQFLQQEVLRLQGEIDKLHRQAEILKKQHLQDYVELDKRLRGMLQSSSTVSVGSEKIAQPQPKAEEKVIKGQLQEAKSVDSYAQYKHAYSLIKAKKFTEAKQEFNKFISDYPHDQLVANCYYWLGELYILDRNPLKAQEAFDAIVENYPSHSKKPEAMYKLGRIYFDAGDKAKARQQMEQVLEVYHGKSINAVRLANDFLKANF